MALVMKPPPQLGTGARQRFGAASYWLEWSAPKIKNVREVAGTRFLGIVAQYATVLGESVEDGGLYEMFQERCGGSWWLKRAVVLLENWLLG